MMEATATHVRAIAGHLKTFLPPPAPLYQNSQPPETDLDDDHVESVCCAIL